jgi:hypothetical protein
MGVRVCVCVSWRGGASVCRSTGCSQDTGIQTHTLHLQTALAACEETFLILSDLLHVDGTFTLQYVVFRFAMF